MDFLSRLCFIRCLLLPFFAFFLYCSQLFKKGVGIVPWPHFCRPFAEIREGFKGKTYFFRDHSVFRMKILKNWDRFNVVNFLFIIRSNVVSIKFVLIKGYFDQVSFRSSVVSIKSRFDQVSFDQLSFDQLSGHGMCQVL